MKTNSLILSLLLLASLAYADVTPPIDFSGGVDRTNIPSAVADNRAVDCQNMIGDIVGSVSKRNGSERYINQAISTNPIVTLYSTSLDVGTATKRILFATTMDSIYVSTGNANPVWKKIKGGLITWNQNFSFTNSKGKIVMTGDALTDPIYQYDMLIDSFTPLFNVDSSTEAPRFLAKLVLARDGYLIAANCMDNKDLNGNTTYYGDRIYYSLFNQISSFTYSRFINIRTNDGESITAMTDKGTTVGSQILIYKPRNIMSLTYTVLNLTIYGGDIAVAEVGSGFGCISPKGVVNIGKFDFVPTFDGIVLYDGGRQSRLNIVDELKPISTLIKSDYERTIQNNTYNLTTAVYYPKKQWVVMSFSDPQFFPQGRQNRTYILDLRTDEWWPQNNLIAGSFTTLSEDGSLLYGDSVDGYVYKTDMNIRSDDARKELSFDSFETTGSWSAVQTIYDTITYIEGNASLQLSQVSGYSYFSSATRMGIISLGEYNDKSLVDKTKDFLDFKLRVSSLPLTQFVRVDIQYGEATSSFTTYFSSVTLSSNTLSDLGLITTNFTEIKIALSSFPIPPDWTSVSSQTVPFANNLTIYGIRFISSGTGASNTNIDDLRVVQGGKNVIQSYYITKQFNLGNVSEKEWRQIILQREKSAESSFNIDIFTDFGYFANSKSVEKDIGKEIFILGYKGTNGITRLKSSDFSVIDSSLMPNANTLDYMNGLATKDNLFMFDKVKHQILMLSRSTMSVIVSTYGSLGSGTTNFNTVNQMCIIENNIYAIDNFNNRIVQLAIQNNQILPVITFGELGTGSTNFFSPSGITADKNFLWISDDGNSKIKKFSLNFNPISEIKYDANTISDSALQNDGKFIYDAYNKIAYQPYFQDVILEKRNKGDMSLIQRIVIRPKGFILNDFSTYTLSGDIALLGKYVFIAFTKDLAGPTGTYYVQKRLKDGFDLVDEYSTAGQQFSVIGDGYPYRPTIQSDKINLQARNGSYIQLKYYDNEEDNNFRLFNYSFDQYTQAYEEQNK